MNLKHFRVCLVAAVALIAATASAADAPKARIGVSLLTLANPFFQELGAAMRDEGAKHGMEVLLMAGEFDAARQRNQVADFIVRRVNAIVLAPCDSKAVGTAIQEANKAGIPVFTTDIAALAPGAKVVSHIATDNLSGGRLAAPHGRAQSCAQAAVTCALQARVVHRSRRLPVGPAVGVGGGVTTA